MGQCYFKVFHRILLPTFEEAGRQLFPKFLVDGSVAMPCHAKFSPTTPEATHALPPSIFQFITYPYSCTYDRGSRQLLCTRHL